MTDVEKMEAFLIQTPDIASARSLHTIQDYIKKVEMSLLKLYYFCIFLNDSFTD